MTVPGAAGIRTKRSHSDAAHRRGGIEPMTNSRPGGRREATEEDAIRRIIARMVEQFPELPASEVEHAVYGRYDTFDDSSIRDYVPVLVERATRRQLADQRYQRYRA